MHGIKTKQPRANPGQSKALSLGVHLPSSEPSPMMRSRYEPSDTADDGEEQPQPQQQQHKLAAEPSTGARLNKSDFRLMCANERLYEAYAELHGLAQGEKDCVYRLCGC